MLHAAPSTIDAAQRRLRLNLAAARTMDHAAAGHGKRARLCAALVLDRRPKAVGA